MSLYLNKEQAQNENSRKHTHYIIVKQILGLKS